MAQRYCKFAIVIHPYTHPNCRVLAEWRGWEGARSYARQHGEAQVFRADGSVRRLTSYDGRTVRQRDYHPDRVYVARPAL